MVEYYDFDVIFGALSDSTRRDILERLMNSEQRLTDLAERYKMSLAGVAKHVDVLVRAKLITKHRKGREQLLQLNADSIVQTKKLLQTYEDEWTARYGRLETLLQKEEN